MVSKTIDMATAFSPTPAGRVRDDGPYTGEAFREDILVPALGQYDEVCVDLNDVEGFGSSFLEEAFGGLVRHKHLSKDEVRQKLRILTDDAGLEEEIKGYIAEAIEAA